MTNGINANIISAAFAKKRGMPSNVVTNTAMRGLLGGGIASAVIDDKTFKEVKDVIDERDALRIERDILRRERDACNDAWIKLRNSPAADVRKIFGEFAGKGMQFHDSKGK